MFITILCIIITHIITYIGARQMSYSILPISGKPKRFVSVELHSSCMKGGHPSVNERLPDVTGFRML
jgi:hypothetical protein